MQEQLLERKVCQYIKQLGGIAVKWVSSGAVGVPDRICILPNGQIFFVELKSPSGKGRLSVKQKKMLKKLINLGHRAVVVQNFEELKKEIENEER